jgi:uncharacterized protein YuzE
MRISYHKDTDSLYIHLKGTPTLESEEVAPDTVLHFDEDGNVTGIEVYSDAREKVDLSEVELSGIEDEQAPTSRVSCFWGSLPRSYGEEWRKIGQRHFRPPEANVFPRYSAELFAAESMIAVRVDQEHLGREVMRKVSGGRRLDREAV